jgi:hypothetical protein
MGRSGQFARGLFVRIFLLGCYPFGQKEKAAQAAATKTKRKTEKVRARSEATFLCLLLSKKTYLCPS